MERLAEIKFTKNIILVSERILLKYLPPEEIDVGISRGKAYLRGQRVEGFEQRERVRQAAIK